MKKNRGGLGVKWGRTMKALWSLIRVYDSLNHIMSLGRDISFRKEGIVAAVNPGGRILDAGCGPGTMTKLTFEIFGRNVGQVDLVDPSSSMLSEAKNRISGKRAKISLEKALMENLPFRNGVFQTLMCGFSLRDAINIEKALAEMFRVLRSNGRLLIVDLGKPDNKVLRTIIGAYWRFYVPLIARLVLGKTGRLYSILYTTYRFYPNNAELQRLIEKHTEKVVVKKKMFGGVLIVVAEK